ncbi:MAG: hypothetical protein IPP46_07610 [Bacteroidetes bacterium]|nr:hypothetical protein [Bacteroidota bacterium]
MKALITGLFLFIFLNSQAQNLYFPPLTGNAWDTISPVSLGWCPDKIDSLTDYLENKNTKAFILLKDGKIVIENILAHLPRTVSGTGPPPEKHSPHLP